MSKIIVPELINNHMDSDKIFNTFLFVYTPEITDEIITTKPIRVTNKNLEDVQNNVQLLNFLDKYKLLLKVLGNQSIKNKKVSINTPTSATVKRPKNAFISLDSARIPDNCLLVSELITEYEIPDFEFDISSFDENQVIMGIVTMGIPKKNLSRYFEESLENILFNNRNNSDFLLDVSIQFVTKFKNEKIMKLDSDTYSVDNELKNIFENANHPFINTIQMFKEIYISALASRSLRLKKNLNSWNSLYDFEGVSVEK